MMKLSEAEVLLNSCKYDPNAERCYDVFAGGFSWSDEVPDVGNTKISLTLSLFLRPIFNYRASLTRGEEAVKNKKEWEALKESIPDWPGFRDDRIYGNLREELLLHEKQIFECE